MAGNSSSLTFKLFGKDVSASKAFKNVERSGSTAASKLGGLGAAFAGIGTAAVVAGGLIAIDFGKQSVDAFIDAQEKAVAFDDAMARFDGLSSYTGQLTALAEALALKTKFDDDETKAAIATLARYNLTGKQLETLTPLVQDYAAATGKDLGGAASTVGKALLGNVRALKELGINYKPTGDKAKDLAAITQLLRDKVGGFAEKEGKTAAGTSSILANQFGEVKEQVGSYLVPALTWLGQQIIQKVIPAIQTAVAWLSEHLGPVIQDVAAWIMDVAWPALQNLAAAFMENVWPAIQQVAGMVAENLQPAIAALSEFWTTTLLPAIKGAAPVLLTVAKVIGIVIGAIIVLVSWVVGKLAPLWTAVMSRLLPPIMALGKAGAAAVEWVIENFGNLIEFVQTIPGLIKSAFKGVAELITAPFRAAFEAIKRLWNSTLGGFSVHIPGIPGTDIGNYDVSIPKLAKGGIVTRPTLALIGEAGPEAVVPLGRGGYGGGIVIQITQPLGTPEQIARAVNDALRRGGSSGRANIKYA